MYTTIFDIVNWVFIALMILSAVLLLYKVFYHIYALAPDRKFPDAKINHKYAILIPARNESRVIRGLLNSLRDQDYPKELYDVYVIIESKEDKTYEICGDYENVTPFIRPNLDVKSKGGALDQMVKYLIESGIAESRGYEAYFIFDADNSAQSNFLTEMNKTFDAGYEIALSYRNSKNWNDGWVASCSALTFSMINTFNNKCRARFNERVVVSGTGFYIASRVLHELGGWPFQTLTEDMEISTYAVLNDIKGSYNANTQFYDEQPVSLKVSWNQRIRWVKGHMQVTKKYNKKLIKKTIEDKNNRLGKAEFAVGIIPIAIPLLSVILYSSVMLVLGIVGVCIGVSPELWRLAFIKFAFAILGIYLFMVIYTLVVVLVEKKHTNLTTKNAIGAIFMNPIFLSTYIPIAIAALLKKEVKWVQIARK